MNVGAVGNMGPLASGEASSDELVMQNSLRMCKHDPACAMHSCSKSMSYQPIFTSCIIQVYMSTFYYSGTVQKSNYHCQGKLVLNKGY